MWNWCELNVKLTWISRESKLTWIHPKARFRRNLRETFHVNFTWTTISREIHVSKNCLYSCTRLVVHPQTIWKNHVRYRLCPIRIVVQWCWVKLINSVVMHQEELLSSLGVRHVFVYPSVVVNFFFSISSLKSVSLGQNKKKYHRFSSPPDPIFLWKFLSISLKMTVFLTEIQIKNKFRPPAPNFTKSWMRI